MLEKVNKTHIAVIGVGATLAALGLSLSYSPGSMESSSASPSQVVSVDPVNTAPTETPRVVVPTMPSTEAPGASEIQLLINEIVSKLVNDHSHEKHDLAFQVTLKDIRDGLLIDFPERGGELFERILQAAFPDLVEDILALIAKKDIYDAWLLDNMIELNEMAALEQKEALWIKRYEIFGKEDAEQIWQPERSEQEEREEAMHTVLEMLGQSKDVAMHDRIFILKRAYDENYFGSVEDLVLDASGVLAQTIFSMDVVQDELGAMAPAQRQEEIDSVRRQLGFDETQIEWLAQRDQERDQRWQNGYAYMEERSQIEQSYEGAELERQLDQLREKYFQNEAPTIKKEEELIGFFRYTRPRVYGRN